jgi:hypothetical protein
MAFRPFVRVPHHIRLNRIQPQRLGPENPILPQLSRNPRVVNLPAAQEGRLPVDHEVAVATPVNGLGRRGRGSGKDAVSGTEGG